MTRLPVRLGVLVVAVGGVFGALARAILLDAWPAPPGTFPWSTFAINVLGSALLALLPAVPAVRDHRWWPLFLGTGVMGGFTTMSSAVVQTAQLHGRPWIAATYLIGTLLAALAAVHLAHRLSQPAEQDLVDIEEGDL